MERSHHGQVLRLAAVARSSELLRHGRRRPHRPTSRGKAAGREGDLTKSSLTRADGSRRSAVDITLVQAVARRRGSMDGGVRECTMDWRRARCSHRSHRADLGQPSRGHLGRPGPMATHRARLVPSNPSLQAASDTARGSASDWLASAVSIRHSMLVEPSMAVGGRTLRRAGLATDTIAGRRCSSGPRRVDAVRRDQSAACGGSPLSLGPMTLRDRGVCRWLPHAALLAIWAD